MIVSTENCCSGIGARELLVVNHLALCTLTRAFVICLCEGRLVSLVSRWKILLLITCVFDYHPPLILLGIENAFENELDMACAFGTIHRCMQCTTGIDTSHKHMYVMAQ